MTDAPLSLTDVDIPDESGEWSPKPRVVWTTGTETCASCGSTLDLDSTHYYVRVDSPDDEGETAELLFCSRACARDPTQS